MLLDVVRTGICAYVRRERRLPIRGEVLVQEGQEVHPDDLVAEAHLPGELYLVDLSHALDIDREDVHHCLVRQPGERLLEDDVIAQDGGAFPRVVRTTVAGRFAALHQGLAVMEVAQKTLQVSACLPGVVESVIPEYGAVIATKGFLVQGVWGNDGAGSAKLGDGTLTIVEESWSTPLTTAMLAETEDRQVIVTGQVVDADVLDHLAEAGVAGLITGVMAPGLIPAAAWHTLPIMVLQGFGQLPADRTYIDLFKSYAGERVYVHAAAADRLAGIRPELIVPKPGENKVVESKILMEMAIGSRVRICSGTAQGKPGKVVAMVDEPPQFASGLRVPAVVVEVEDGERFTVPQQNLVILG